MDDEDEDFVIQSDGLYICQSVNQQMNEWMNEYIWMNK